MAATDGASQPVKQDAYGKQPSSFIKNKGIPEVGDLAGSRQPRNNSTSSLYVRTVLSEPNLLEVIRCMSKAIKFVMVKCSSLEQGHKHVYKIFSEVKHPLMSAWVDVSAIPSADKIYAFLHRVFKLAQLDPEVAILSLVYIERVAVKGNAAFTPETFRRISMAALIVASKVWHDQNVWNVDFVSVFDKLEIQDLVKLLTVLGFNVAVSRSEYVDYYTSLRVFSTDFPLEPLSPSVQARLDRTTGKQYPDENLVKYQKQISQGEVAAIHSRKVLS